MITYHKRVARRGIKPLTYERIYLCDDSGKMRDDEGELFEAQTNASKYWIISTLYEYQQQRFKGRDVKTGKRNKNEKHSTEAVFVSETITTTTLNGWPIDEFTKLEILRMIEGQQQVIERAVVTADLFSGGVSHFGIHAIIKEAEEKTKTLSDVLELIARSESTS